MTPPYVQRKVPRYSTIAFVLHYAYWNEYPKNAEKFIWGIPSKYKKAVNREISAITTSFLYDGTRASFKVAQKVDKLFKGSPYDYLADSEYNDLVLKQNQNEIVYGKIRIRDLYYFFHGLANFYGQYKSIYNAYNNARGGTPIERLQNALKSFPPLADDSLTTFVRLNFFLFLTAHCFDDFKVESYSLLVPVYPTNLPLCRQLRLINQDSKYSIELIHELTDNLKWFSEQHPLTYWIGILAYREAVREKDKALKKLARERLKKHHFKKR